MFTRWNAFDSDFGQSFAVLQELVRRMDGAVRDYQWPYQSQMSGGGNWLSANIHDRGDELVLFAAVPGFAENDINLTATGDTLTLTGQRKVTVPEGYSAHRRERADQSFSRSFTLPCKVDFEKVQASVKDGILTVRVGKAPEAKPRQIPVNAGR